MPCAADLVEEEAGVVALAHEAAVVVGEDDDDGVDGVAGHGLAEGVEREHSLGSTGVGRDRGAGVGRHDHLRLSRRNIPFCAV